MPILPLEWNFSNFDHKQIDISPEKQVYWRTIRTEIWDMRSNDEPCTSPEKQRRGILFYRFGRGCCKERVHWRKLKVQIVMTFHWLRHGSLPLAELLPGKKKFFLPIVEVEVVMWLKMQGTSGSVEVSSVCWVTGAWQFSLLASCLHIKWGFCLLILTKENRKTNILFQSAIVTLFKTHIFIFFFPFHFSLHICFLGSFVDLCFLIY